MAPRVTTPPAAGLLPVRAGLGPVVATSLLSADADAVQAAAHVGWALAGLGLLGLFLSRRPWRPWLVLPVGLMLPSLWLTGDMNSALAGFLAIGITLAGCLAFGWRWLPPYLLVASGVALVLLLASDSYAAFGLIFLALAAGTAGIARERLTGLVRSGLEQRPPARAMVS